MAMVSRWKIRIHQILKIRNIMTFNNKLFHTTPKQEKVFSYLTDFLCDSPGVPPE